MSAATTQDAIKAAEAAQSVAEKEFRELEREIQAEKREASAAIDQRYGNRMAAVRDDLSNARRAVDAAKNSAPDHPWTGKRVVMHYRCGPTHRRELVHMDGVVEMRRLGTVFPANIRHGLPALGKPFVRLLKKDGTPGMKIEGMMVWGRPWKLVDQCATSVEDGIEDRAE